MSARRMPLGPLMLDIEAKALSAADRRRLTQPLVGGVILFTRNYESTQQIAELTREIRALRTPPLLIAVDQEGGRVQRLRNGFTPLPPMRAIGRLWDEHPRMAKRLAHDAGYVLGAELRAVGVDFSFAPVLDLDYGVSSVIGDRAFHRHPQAVTELAHALILGLNEAGMSAVGKHFPGHGAVAADSHVDVPVDGRDLADLEFADLIPFRQLIELGLAGIMAAHVVYPRVDDWPASLSRRWLNSILRGAYGFEGAIFSDDLAMAGARVAGDVTARAQAALRAGCDMVLLCNRPDLADELIAQLTWEMHAAARIRLARMHGRPYPPNRATLQKSARYAQAVQRLTRLSQTDAA